MTDIIITVTRKGEDTGIWHIGTDADNLIAKAQQSVSDAFGDSKRVILIRLDRRNRDDANGTLVVNHTGENFRWEIATV
jgi:hypothetical protein